MPCFVGLSFAKVSRLPRFNFLCGQDRRPIAVLAAPAPRTFCWFTDRFHRQHATWYPTGGRRQPRLTKFLIVRFLPAEYCFLSPFVCRTNRRKRSFILITKMRFDTLHRHDETAKKRKNPEIDTPLHRCDTCSRRTSISVTSRSLSRTPIGEL